MRECPNCHRVSSGKYCTACGVEMTFLPRCNWCDTSLYPSADFCEGCGKARQAALSTFPPPGKIKQFFAKLFGSMPIQKSAE